MKNCKALRIATGLLTLIAAIALLSVAILTALPFAVGATLLGFFEQLQNGVSAFVDSLPPLSNLPQNVGELLFLAIGLALPAILWLVASLTLFSKQKKGRGKYVFAAIITLIAAVWFAIVAEMTCETFFGEMQIVARIVAAAIGALIALLAALLLVGLAHAKKREPQPAIETCEEEQTAETETDEQVETEQTVATTQTEPTAEQQVPQNKAEEISPATEYVPVDMHSVSEIVEDTYGNNVTVKGINMKKIEAARSLLDAGIISKDEYIALVDAYLKDAN